MEVTRPSLRSAAGRSSSLLVPNVPGFRRAAAAPKSNQQTLRLHHGHMYVLDPVGQRPATAPASVNNDNATIASFRTTTGGLNEAASYADLSGRYSIRQQKQDRNCKAGNLPFGRTPKFLKYYNQVLNFTAYYSEAVYESASETKRIRKCVIYYYLEDDSIQMVEHQQDNSGMPQGAFIRRHQVIKSDGSTVRKEDLRIGAYLEVYGKTLHIVSCDDFTRRYLASEGNAEAASAQYIDVPEDTYNTTLRSRMQRETGADMSIPRNRKMHQMKQFMEARLGKPQSKQDLGMFLTNERKVLNFNCVWDDTENLYGDVLVFNMNYFLSDDTIEVLSVHKTNNGRDPVPKLLRRGKITKPEARRPTTQGDHAENDFGGDSWTWYDFYIGVRVDIHGRTLIILDADDFTRQFYAEQGLELGEPIEAQRPRPPPIERRIPAYNGFGSEEDSMRSVFSIRPTPPKKDLKKLKENSGRTLRFSISMIGSANGAEVKPSNSGRLFVLMLFLEDDTITIREPPRRNSGHIGGNFLFRSRVKKDEKNYYTPEDFSVGAQVVVNSQIFEIVEADEYTLRYMEANSRRKFPQSSIDAIVQKMLDSKEAIGRAVIKYDKGDGVLTIPQLAQLCIDCDLGLSPQEFLTLKRKLDRKKKDKFVYSKLLKLLTDEPMPTAH